MATFTTSSERSVFSPFRPHLHIIRDGIPQALFGLMLGAPFMFATAFAGHMGLEALATLALAVAAFFTLPQSIGIGASLVFQGAISNAIGSGDTEKVYIDWAS